MMKLSKWIKNFKGNKLVQHLKEWYDSTFDFSGQSKVPLLPEATSTTKANDTKVSSIDTQRHSNAEQRGVHKVLNIISHQPLQEAAENIDKYNKYMHTNMKLTTLGLISKTELQKVIYHFINQNRLDGNRQQNVVQLQQELKQVNNFDMSYFSYKQDSTVGQLTSNDIQHALTVLKHVLCNSQTYASVQK